MVVIFHLVIVFSYIVSDHLDFAEAIVLTALTVGPSQEEAVVPPMLDLVGLNVLYQSMIQHQP